MNSASLDSVPRHVREIMACLFRSGFQVWVVGGALRDMLSGRAPKDYDLATDAPADAIMKLFSRVIPVGIAHGTVRIHVDEGDIEVTTVAPPGMEGILLDLDRRDFTMNALALSYPEGHLLDPHGGTEDLRRHLLKTVGNPRSRFKEDPLRILRAARFMSAYGCRMDGRMAAAVKDELAGMDGIAAERIRDEMFKLLSGKFVIEAFEWMRRCGVLRKIMPELQSLVSSGSKRSYPFDPYRHTLYTIGNCPPRLTVRLAALLHHLDRRESLRKRPAPGRPGSGQGNHRVALSLMKRWRMSRKQIQEVNLLLNNLLPPNAVRWGDVSLRRLMAEVGHERLEDLLDLSHAHLLSRGRSKGLMHAFEVLRSKILREVALHPPLHIGDLEVKGEDVMRVLHLKPGPVVGEILQAVLQRVLQDPQFNRREALMAYIQQRFNNQL
ncbi:CCA tRNA nucleotidyltransferase [Desulforhabdus sp. TSK]|uniref:CCA tRNA nucleotidyltransferase n=1 Tax=Desulforhabdus sp. TSK TaxID=2925014 RepID=UPI001FC842F4|nr:CCA tRNA nucleotidyltransferase [Desulforhabdus sp. TSK]